MDTKTTPKKKIIRTRINLQRRLMNKEQLEEHLKNLKHEANQRYFQKKTANVVRKWKRPYDIKVEELEKKLMDMDLLLKSQGKQITNDSPITKPTDKINVSESESESETSSSETETKRVSKKVKFISNNPIQQPQQQYTPPQRQQYTPYPQQQYTPYQQQQRQVMFV